MEQLKVAIADKILEVTSGNPEEIKYKLGKIQRFSDFAEACKTLMSKYPEIETELMEMVKDNDFDASRASRKVDSIINREHRLSTVEPDYQAPQIPQEIPIITPPPANMAEETEIIEEQEPVLEEIREYMEEEIPFEETTIEENVVEPENEILFSTVSEEDLKEEKRAKQKKYFTLAWQILAIALAIFILVIVVKFVVSYWKTILIVLASLLALYLLWVFLRKRNRKNNR